jgi:hypothetical protein
MEGSAAAAGRPSHLSSDFEEDHDYQNQEEEEDYGEEIVS